MLNKTVIVTAIVVWLLISFVPQLSAAALIGLGKKSKG
jgi:uncharacterized membrane protein